MTDKPANIPAFPYTCKLGPEGGELTNFGMTLRDYFAAAALQGIMSCEAIHLSTETKEIARTAYGIAGAMLKARQ